MKHPALSRCFVVSVCIALTVGYAPLSSSAAETRPASNNAAHSLSYEQYRQQHKDFAANGEDIVLSIAQISSKGNAEVRSNADRAGTAAVVMQDDSTATWHFAVPRDSLYTMTVHYLPVEGSSSAVEQSLKLDGEVPFSGLHYIKYSRTFTQQSKVQTDLNGNDIQPRSTEVFAWDDNRVSDPSGYVQNPYVFALSGGEHTLTLTGMRGGVAISRITLSAPSTPPAYADVLASYPDAPRGTLATTEGEQVYQKSDVTIVPLIDRTSPRTSPQDERALKLNTIGGTKWQSLGQWISWKVKVESDGLYYIAPRFRQNYQSGIYVSRRLYIDGKVPFAEAESLRFNYSDKWQCSPLGNGKDNYLFYLTTGEHEIRLEVVLGDVGSQIGTVQTSLEELNQIYRNILMITGPTPDRYRDYNFTAVIPDTLKDVKTQYDILSEVTQKIVETAGSNSEYVAVLNKITFQLRQIYEAPDDKIPDVLTKFKSNLGSLGTWLISARNQPLQIDKIYAVPQDESSPPTDSGFFTRLAFQVQCFVSSFTQDYEAIGLTSSKKYDKEITVWAPTGRDQAQIIRQLSDTFFSTRENIKVNLQLVTSGNLLPSVLAGSGPDVALSNGPSEPMNYAVRNAVIAMSDFGDYQEMAKNFHPNSLVPFTYEGQVYALPENLTFPMFFYRTDIFAELGLTPPETWDEFLNLIPVLQSQNMNIGLPGTNSGNFIPSYSMLLYQNGGKLYKDGGASTNLDAEVSLSTFKTLTQLFTLYQLPVSYDFANRFRTGEMPCGIQDYTLYNQLTVFAPEIKGLWNFIPVPGVKRKDGTIDHVSVASSNAVMIMKSTADPDSSWKFVKWWLSTDAQSRYGVEMESVLGAAAKQPTANIQALTRMNWTRSEYTNILSQLDDIYTNPQVPGGYYTERILDFAFIKSYNDLSDPIENLKEYMDELNQELTRKYAEFHRSNKDGE